VGDHFSDHWRHEGRPAFSDWRHASIHRQCECAKCAGHQEAGCSDLLVRVAGFRGPCMELVIEYVDSTPVCGGFRSDLRALTWISCRSQAIDGSRTEPAQKERNTQGRERQSLPMLPGDERVSFFPVVHLLTGPPGLIRNGGVWKAIKAGLRDASDSPRLMVQALHFTAYGLSDRAWESWFAPWYGGVRLQRELEDLLGPSGDVFLDSGGFQILHGDKIDLSPWGMDLSPEGVLELQLKFGPSRIASLDSPIPRGADPESAKRHMSASVRNAAWLASALAGSERAPVAYLAVHGRTPEEVAWCVRALERSLPAGTLNGTSLAIALGSQVPLSRQPTRILQNCEALLSWMDSATGPETPLHLFGVGESVVGELLRRRRVVRPLSFDNSTYVQAAFRKRVFDPISSEYRDFDPSSLGDCECPGCALLGEIGRASLVDLLTRPPYRPLLREDRRVNRSDIWAGLALHNLHWWKARLTTVRFPAAEPGGRTVAPSRNPRAHRSGYAFPLKGFEPRAHEAALLLLPCSRSRPYAESAVHRRILTHLESDGWEEGTDFDRVTLSGLYGPVHWDQEEDPAIMGYDFPLTYAIHRRHVEFLRIQTATVLGVIAKHYRGIVAYLRPKLYGATFGPVVEGFDARVASSPHEICRGFEAA
jgi:7-cyano-7-deazaguanine tRNA-ribosyltransferase